MRAFVLVVVAACGSASGAPDATPDASPWSAGPAMPGARLEPGVATLGDRLVIVGGFDASIKIVSEVDVLDTLTGTWSRLPDAPVAWTHVDLAAANGSLYLLGGLETDQYLPVGSAWVLDANATAWRMLAPMPTGLERGAAGVVVQPPYIYLVGGAQQNDSIASVLAYDIGQDTWTRLPDLPAPRSHPAATILPDGTLLAVGGLGTLDSSNPTAEVAALPVGATAWSARTPMPTARGGCAYALFGVRFVCAGGEASGLALDVTEAYDWSHDTWSTLAPMPLPRAGTQGARLGTRLFVAGGAHHLRYEPDATIDVLTIE